jgi:hypothetical protein
MLIHVSAVAAILLNLNGNNVLLPDSLRVESRVVQADRAMSPVSGRVIGSDGLPVANAIVSLLVERNGEVVLKTRTDSTGMYKINVPTKGSYVLRVICLGYKPVVLSVPQLVDGHVASPDIIMHQFMAWVELAAHQVSR